MCVSQNLLDSLFIVAPIVCWGSVFGPCFDIQYLVSVYFSNHLDGEEKTDCIALTDFLMPCDIQCSVILPCGAMSWSAACDCGISDHTHLLFYKFPLKN